MGIQQPADPPQDDPVDASSPSQDEEVAPSSDPSDENSGDAPISPIETAAEPLVVDPITPPPVVENTEDRLEDPTEEPLALIPPQDDPADTEDEEDSPPSAHSSEADGNGDDPATGWICSKCTYRNHPDMTACELCQTARFATGPTESPSQDEPSNASQPEDVEDAPPSASAVPVQHRISIGMHRLILKMSDGWKFQRVDDPVMFNEHFGPGKKADIIKTLILAGKWSDLEKDQNKRSVARKELDGYKIEFSCNENGGDIIIRYKGSNQKSPVNWSVLFDKDTSNYWGLDFDLSTIGVK